MHFPRLQSPSGQVGQAGPLFVKFLVVQQTCFRLLAISRSCLITGCFLLWAVASLKQTSLHIHMQICMLNMLITVEDIMQEARSPLHTGSSSGCRESA